MHEIFSQLILEQRKLYASCPHCTSGSNCFSLRSNELVTKCLETAAEKITKTPSESTLLNKAKVALEQGLQLLASCQKLIKIADHSESTCKLASSSVTMVRLIFLCTDTCNDGTNVQDLHVSILAVK